MSSSMPIPKRKQPVHDVGMSPASSSSSSSVGSVPSSWSMSASSTAKGKQRACESPTTSEVDEGYYFLSARRPSLLGSSLSKSEYTVINLAHSDGPPRLVTCVKSSQGFDWNQELFLPSYADYDSQDLEHRPDPVQDIILTDEEMANIMPQ